MGYNSAIRKGQTIIDTRNKVGESENADSEHRKPEKGEYKLCDSFYRRFQKMQTNLERQKADQRFPGDEGWWGQKRGITKGY